jgi:hypothetical protein
MNILKKIILIIFILSFSIWNIFAYDLTDKDYSLVEKIDEKIFNIIDSRKNITAEKVIKIIDKAIIKKFNNDRVVAILEMISDDISYEYYLWKYQEVELEENFVNEKFSWKQENDDESEPELRAEYYINKNSISLISWKKNPEDIIIFSLFTTLVPLSARENIITYKVYNKPDGNTFAYVNQDEDNQSKWNLVVNTALFFKNWELDKQESIHTLVHEFFHTASLSATQMNHWDYDVCENYELQEWCLNSNSYLNKFINLYWKENFEASQNWGENNFYLEDESAYVTEYASTNPWEDIAESFTYFVLQPKPKSSENISDKKILFFYNFKKLVKLRNEIRKWIKNVKNFN